MDDRGKPPTRRKSARRSRNAGTDAATTETDSVDGEPTGRPAPLSYAGPGAAVQPPEAPPDASPASASAAKRRRTAPGTDSPARPVGPVGAPGRTSTEVTFTFSSASAHGVSATFWHAQQPGPVPVRRPSVEPLPETVSGAPSQPQPPPPPHSTALDDSVQPLDPRNLGISGAWPRSLSLPSSLGSSASVAVMSPAANSPAAEADRDADRALGSLMFLATTPPQLTAPAPPALAPPRPRSLSSDELLMHTRQHLRPSPGQETPYTLSPVLNRAPYSIVFGSRGPIPQRPGTARWPSAQHTPTALPSRSVTAPPLATRPPPPLLQAAAVRPGTMMLSSGVRLLPLPPPPAPSVFATPAMTYYGNSPATPGVDVARPGLLSYSGPVSSATSAEQPRGADPIMARLRQLQREMEPPPE
eukprot:Unigene3691_Nuclearia_a/m.11258 Unigene3691_Nuclearia_a/g.11258  ORF Unigene3691_Nuclearia_a/g.11258 Unigene3691_Nuclearia_a/m.11258 type:complete len:415 (-) Unigene3691_Nuclearia_a:63-1307(-)